MTTLVFPDYLPDLRYWLRNDPILNPLNGGRVFFRLPKTTTAPMMRISQMGGGQQVNTDTPLMDIQCIIEIWGMQDSDYQSIRQLRLALEHVCFEYVAGTPLNPSSNTVLWNAAFNSGWDSPDPDTGWPRIICHVTFTVAANAPTVL
jgi:hypothetical protein